MTETTFQVTISPTYSADVTIPDIPTKDAGPFQTLLRSFTSQSDFSVERQITELPLTGQKIVLMDILFSVDKQCEVTILEQTTRTVLWAGFVPAYMPVQLTLRGFLKAQTSDVYLMMKTSEVAAGRVTTVYFSEE